MEKIRLDSSLKKTHKWKIRKRCSTSLVIREIKIEMEPIKVNNRAIQIDYNDYNR